MNTTKESIKPEVGMGVTERIGSDCYPYTVVNVISDKKIEVTRDTATATENSNYFGSQEYAYESNMDGNRMVLSRRKNGRWYQVGQKMECWSGFRLGHRRYYQDPHF